MVTTIHMQSSTPWVGRITLFTACDPAADLVAEVAGDMAADQGADRLAQGAVLEALSHIGVLRIEALGIADREFQAVVPRQIDQFVGLLQGQRQRLLQEHVLARAQAVAGHGKVGRLRGRGDEIGVDGVDRQQLLVVVRRRLGAGVLGDLVKALGLDLGDMQFVDQRAVGAGIGTDSPAPAGTDDADVDPFHPRRSPFSVRFRDLETAAHGPRTPEALFETTFQDVILESHLYE
jgi:hypothetical protein